MVSTVDMYYMCSIKIALNVIWKIRDIDNGNGEKLPSDSSFLVFLNFLSFLLLVIFTQSMRNMDYLERLL